MTFNVDFNNVRNSVITAYNTAAAKVSEWAGRSVTIIKTHTETALPYLQDQRIAAASLVAVNLILIQLGDLFGRLVKKCLPQRSEGQRAFSQVIEVIVGMGTIGVGVAAFSKYTKLPFSQLAITGISVATLFARIIIFTPKE